MKEIDREMMPPLDPWVVIDVSEDSKFAILSSGRKVPLKRGIGGKGFWRGPRWQKVDIKALRAEKKINKDQTVGPTTFVNKSAPQE